MIHHLHREQFISGDLQAVWDFFATPRNLDRLTPPLLRFEIVGTPEAPMYAGQMIEYRVGILRGVTTRWVTEITHLRAGDYFVDEQRIGPYKLWHHEHRFASFPDRGGVHMTDHVTYDPGWSVVGEILNALWIRQRLATIFDFRAARIRELFPSPEIASH